MSRVEELIRSLIAARFPDNGVSGEELADTPGLRSCPWRGPPQACSRVTDQLRPSPPAFRLREQEPQIGAVVHRIAGDGEFAPLPSSA
jgi:hypothetical protein